MNDEIISTFIAQCDEISVKAAAIAELADDHFGTNPDAINWGDIASNEHTIELLNQLLEWLNLEVNPKMYNQ